MNITHLASDYVPRRNSEHNKNSGGGGTPDQMHALVKECTLLSEILHVYWACLPVYLSGIHGIGMRGRSKVAESTHLTH